MNLNQLKSLFDSELKKGDRNNIAGNFQQAIANSLKKLGNGSAAPKNKIDYTAPSILTRYLNDFIESPKKIELHALISIIYTSAIASIPNQDRLDKRAISLCTEFTSHCISKLGEKLTGIESDASEMIKDNRKFRELCKGIGFHQIQFKPTKPAIQNQQENHL